MTLTANGSGTITGKFALSGSAAVKTATFTGSNGSVAKGILFASSFIGEATNKKHLSAESVIFSAPDIDDVVPLFQVVTPLLSGEVSGISLFVINKGSSFISVQLRDVVNGLPDKVLSTSVLQSSVLTDNTWTNFLFSVPVPVSIGSDYAICIHCSDATGEVAVLDLTQQATSHSPNIKGFGASFDGIDYQLYKNKKLSFKLLMASYTSNSRSIPLGDVSVNDVSRLLVFSPTSRNIGGVASSRLLLTLPDLSVIEALDGQVVKLPSSVTGSISIVRQLYANSRFSHKGVGGSQLVVGDIVDVASYVSGRIKTEDGCRLRLDVVGSVPDGSGVLTYVSDADTVNWELMTLVGSPEPQGAGVFKYSYLSDVIFGTNDIVFRVRLNGTSDAVPVIKSVSAETVFTYVYALKNGDPLNRFKVADGVDEDDAASKGQLEVLANAAITNQQVLDLIYPVGIAIEFGINFDPNNEWPTTTWIRFAEGRVTVGYKLGDDDFGSVGGTGGAVEHTMTNSNMPLHNHSYQFTGRTGTQFDIGGEAIGSANIPTTQNTGNAGEVSPTPIPTLPPYVVVAKWVRTD